MAALAENTLVSENTLLLHFVAPTIFETDKTLDPVKKGLIDYYYATLEEREKAFKTLLDAIANYNIGFKKDIIPYFKAVIVPFFCGMPIAPTVNKNDRSNLFRYKEHSLDILEYLSNRSLFAYRDAILSIQNNRQSLYDFCELLKNNNQYDTMLSKYKFFNRSVVDKQWDDMQPKAVTLAIIDKSKKEKCLNILLNALADIVQKRSTLESDIRKLSGSPISNPDSIEILNNSIKILNEQRINSVGAVIYLFETGQIIPKEKFNQTMYDIEQHTQQEDFKYLNDCIKEIGGNPFVSMPTIASTQPPSSANVNAIGSATPVTFSSLATAVSSASKDQTVVSASVAKPTTSNVTESELHKQSASTDKQQQHKH